MSNKTIGIKQADGSFFPILNDGGADTKTLELTTVKDDQTTVKVNLYKQYDDKEELEYVDTLLIQNLVPHKKEEPSFNLSIGIDDDGVLSAEVVDPETGATSDTTVSLVTLSEAQLGDTSDFGFVTDTSSDEFGATEFSMPDTNDLEVDSSDDDFSFDDNTLDADFDNELEVEDTLNSVEETDQDDFSLEDFTLDENILVEADSTDDMFDLDDTIEESNSDDDFSFDDNTLDADFNNDIAVAADIDTVEDVDIAEDIGLIDDTDTEEFVFEEDMTLEDNPVVTPEEDFGINKDDMDFSTDIEESAEDFNFTEDVDTDLDTNVDIDLDTNLDDTFAMTDISEELSLTDDFEADFENDSFGTEETVTTESNLNLDLDDDMTMSLNMDEDDSIMFSDTDDTFGADDTIAADDTIEYAEFGKQDSSSSFATQETEEPVLFDKKLNEDMAKRRAGPRYPLSTLVSIICAIICILAVILCFILFSWPSKSKANDTVIVGVEPPIVFEKEKIEQKEQGIETLPPTVEENKIEIVEEEVIIPVKPPVLETAKNDNITYRLIWGDTLWDISDTFYRNPWLYNTIADENDIEDPDYIIAGTDIDIPMR